MHTHPTSPTRPPARLRGQIVPLRQLTSSAIGRIESDYMISRQGSAAAALQLDGSDLALIDATEQRGRLAALHRYLERVEEPMMRISTSQPQPLAPYLDRLEPLYRFQASTAPHLAARLAQVGQALDACAASGQARVGLDYWVLIHPLRLADTLPGQGRNAAHARIGQALENRCAALLSALARAGIRAHRVSGAELDALCLASWHHPALPLADLTELEDAERVQRVRQPEGSLLVGAQAIQTESGLVRSWYLHDVDEALAPDVFVALARQSGVRVLQFWEQVPPSQIKRTLKFNRTVQRSSSYLRPATDVRDFDAEALMQRADAQHARISYQQERVFRYHALLQLWADSLEELDARARTLKRQWEDAGLRLHLARARQQEALVSGLPLAHCLLTQPERNLDAWSLAQLVTPGSRDPLEKSGIWLGAEARSGLLLTQDFFALQNPVVELTGRMGSGKSLAQKSFLTQYAAQGYPCFVVDGASHEYTPVVEALGGVILPLGRADGLAFNPVAFEAADAKSEGDPFLTGQTRFLDWLEAALRPLSDLEQAVVGDAYQRALAAAGILRAEPDTWDQTPPLLDGIWAALLEEPTADPELIGTRHDARMTALALARLLKPLTEGVAGALFNRPTDVPLTNAPVVCFDLFDVPERLRLPMFQQVLAYIGRQTLRRYRYSGSVVVLDEAHLLLEDERSARSLEQLVRTGRKAKQLIFFTQHTSTDSALNRSAQLAHKTAGATLVFHTTPQDEGTLNDLKLTLEEKRLVTALDLPEGGCLFLGPAGHIQLQIDFPPAWYERFTTKPNEVLAREGARLRHEETARRALPAAGAPTRHLWAVPPTTTTSEHPPTERRRHDA